MRFVKVTLKAFIKSVLQAVFIGFVLPLAVNIAFDIYKGPGTYEVHLKEPLRMEPKLLRITAL
ncbi:TPA: hypothetical protein JG832_002403 [Enterobacter hormaechei subsp. xiangfangensis]|nr:hypothetical protein [Enterobacter hormaechei subsp. xiangfangensis]HAV1890541.1 hypothetical protein [Enterobacter hormaechei subsp. xiangfangensis]